MADLLNESGAEGHSGCRGSLFPEDTIAGYECRYVETIAKWRSKNKEITHCYAKQEEKALLNRLEKYSQNHLLFLHNFSVPFDNNISERDLRKAKNREKMTEDFEKKAEMKCTVRL